MFPISDSIKTTRFPIFTLLITAFTAFVFYLQFTSPTDELTLRYSLIPRNIDFSDFSTLYPFITNIFLHGGFIHVSSNLWYLWIFGDDVEATIGRFKFLLIYFLSGITGNLLQYFMIPDSPIPMLGASGAIAGVLGTYYILFPKSYVKALLFIFVFVTIINVPATLMLGYWFLLQIISGIVSLPLQQSGGVAFFAHVGGFLFGVVAGLLSLRRKADSDII